MFREFEDVILMNNVFQKYLAKKNSIDLNEWNNALPTNEERNQMKIVV